jgi:hypothetical protein
MTITWAIERLCYYTLFALLILSIEDAGRNMNLKFLQLGAAAEKVITVIAILGIALLFIWALDH